jgi:hypothetical protein
MMIAIVRGQPSWPELSTSQARGEVAAWIFDHWSELFGDDQSQVLLELWLTQAYDDIDWVRTRLAIAAGNAAPERRREILVELTDHPPGKRIAPALAELARHHFKQERARIQRWFLAAETSDPSVVDNRLAIIAALAGDEAHGRSPLKTLVADRRFKTDDPRVIAAIASAVKAWGGELPADCQDTQALDPLPRKGESIPEPQRVQAGERRARCVSGAVGWLRKQRR